MSIFPCRCTCCTKRKNSGRELSAGLFKVTPLPVLMEHSTHFDDCGCKTLAHEKAIEELLAVSDRLMRAMDQNMSHIGAYKQLIWDYQKIRKKYKK